MKRPLFYFSLAFSVAVGLAGCDSTLSVTTMQVVNEVAWLPDESGMVAIVQQQTQDATTGATTLTGGLYRIGADGSIGTQINTQDKQIIANRYPPIICVSKDGRTAIAQVGINIYRVDLTTNTATIIVANQNLLGVSPGMKYLISTETPPNGFGTSQGGPRLCFVYNLSVNPPREVSEPTLNGVFDSRALWLDDATFAFSGVDSLRHWQVRIYDTTGTVRQIIPEALMAYHQSAYARQANALFVYNDSFGIDRVDLTTGVRTTAIVHDSVQSMDVSASGNLIAYCSGGTVGPYTLYALNPLTGKTNAIATDAMVVVMSPNGDRVAYLRNSGGYPVDIHVLPISLP